MYNIELQPCNGVWLAFYEGRTLTHGIDRAQVFIDAAAELRRVFDLAKVMKRYAKVYADGETAILLNNLDISIEDEAWVSYDDCPVPVVSMPWSKLKIIE